MNPLNDAYEHTHTHTLTYIIQRTYVLRLNGLYEPLRETADAI